MKNLNRIRRNGTAEASPKQPSVAPTEPAPAEQGGATESSLSAQLFQCAIRCSAPDRLRFVRELQAAAKMIRDSVLGCCSRQKSALPFRAGNRVAALWQWN